jgi:hypothetical protein
VFSSGEFLRLSLHLQLGYWHRQYSFGLLWFIWSAIHFRNFVGVHSFVTTKERTCSEFAEEPIVSDWLFHIVGVSRCRYFVESPTYLCFHVETRATILGALFGGRTGFGNYERNHSVEYQHSIRENYL